jgi:hypothetical protein
MRTNWLTILNRLDSMLQAEARFPPLLQLEALVRAEKDERRKKVLEECVRDLRGFLEIGEVRMYNIASICACDLHVF